MLYSLWTTSRRTFWYSALHTFHGSAEIACLAAIFRDTRRGHAAAGGPAARSKAGALATADVARVADPLMPTTPATACSSFRFRVGLASDDTMASVFGLTQAGIRSAGSSKQGLFSGVLGHAGYELAPGRSGIAGRG